MCLGQNYQWKTDQLFTIIHGTCLRNEILRVYFTHLYPVHAGFHLELLDGLPGMRDARCAVIGHSILHDCVLHTEDIYTLFLFLCIVYMAHWANLFCFWFMKSHIKRKRLELKHSLYSFIHSLRENKKWVVLLTLLYSQ